MLDAISCHLISSPIRYFLELEEVVNIIEKYKNNDRFGLRVSINAIEKLRDDAVVTTGPF